MRCAPAIVIFFYATKAFSQPDTSDILTLKKETVLSEVVVRSGLDVNGFLKLVKDDTSFYKAFRNLRVLGFTSLNNVRMFDKKGRTQASLYSKTRQLHSNGCRSMEVLEERTTGDMYDKNGMNYYTAELYASLFFTRGRICGETNIVAGTERDVRSKSGVEKHKEQLKMLFFNPGKKIPGIPFIGDKVDVFDAAAAEYYQYKIDMEEKDGKDCYVFTILPKDNLGSSQKSKIVFDNITTWFDAKTLQILARNYDLSYNTPVYDFDVHMEVKMTRFGELLVPELLNYRGNWKVAFKKRERGIFTATIFDFSN